MLSVKCCKCGKEIEIPTKSGDESKATGLFCVCIDEPMCLECNAEEVNKYDVGEIHNRNCAFGFPKEGDWFYPK